MATEAPRVNGCHAWSMRRLVISITCEGYVDRAVERRVKHRLRPCIRGRPKHEASVGAAHSNATVVSHNWLIRRWCSVEDLYDRVSSIGQSLHAADRKITLVAQIRRFALAGICKLWMQDCSWERQTIKDSSLMGAAVVNVIFSSWPVQ